MWDAEPYNLSMQLKVSSFPFMALMLCESERSVQIIDRIQGMNELFFVDDCLSQCIDCCALFEKGFIDERVLVERMNSCLTQARGHMARARQAQIRR